MSECSDISFVSDFDDECKSRNFDVSNGPPFDVGNFIVVHYNINSIMAPGKLDQLTEQCRKLKIDVLIITESKLDQTIPTNMIKIQGYHEPVRRDRTINGRHDVLSLFFKLVGDKKAIKWRSK